MTELERLRDRVAELEDLLGMAMVKPGIGLSGLSGILLGLLIRRSAVSREFAFRAIYGARPESEQPTNLRIIDTLVHRLKIALRPHGIVVSTERFTGYYLDGENRRRAAELVGVKTNTDAATYASPDRSRNSGDVFYRQDGRDSNRNKLSSDSSHLGVAAGNMASTGHH
jgi:hypothetical protein